MARPTLLLWDIDGTLLRRANAAHREALHEAIRRVHGVDPTAVPVDLAGRTDGEIARRILAGSGVPAAAVTGRAADVREACCQVYREVCPADLSAMVAPGIADLLAELDARDDVRQALLTGNFEPVARLKLARAGIGRFFPEGQGAFGSDAERRDELPPIARRRAGDGRPWPRARTLLVGDTPRDIACARADGLRVVAVATGPHPEGELREADVTVPDGHALRAALAGLLR